MSPAQGLKLEQSTQKEKGSPSVALKAATGLEGACLNTESNPVLIKDPKYQIPAPLVAVPKMSDGYTLHCSPLCAFSGHPYFQQTANSTRTTINRILRLVFPVCALPKSEEWGHCWSWPPAAPGAAISPFTDGGKGTPQHLLQVSQNVP